MRSEKRKRDAIGGSRCSEGVKWIVLTTPIQMSVAQIATFKAIIHDNNRPVQPLNGRELLVDVEANQ